MRKHSRFPGRRFAPTAWLIACSFLAVALTVTADSHLPNLQPFPDPTGLFATFSTQGAIDQSNPFFQSLGTNGRSCVSCHQPSDGWTVTPPHIQARFVASQGLDPIFRPVDGSTCPSDDVSSYQARQVAYSLLLNKGLIRVQLPVPQNAEFQVVGIDDPYSCPQTNSGQLALYRRPLPATNLGFLATVMWDGRETQPNQPILTDLGQQAIDATMGHAQANNPPTQEQVEEIVEFETALYTAQTYDNNAGHVFSGLGFGGPVFLSFQPFYIGINNLGPNFNPIVFDIYQFWAFAEGPHGPARQSVARGETLFNTKQITITGVAGLPDQVGTCSTCHDTPNVGDHSVSAPLNIGIADVSRRTSDLPLYTLYCPATNQTVQTTDPGRAMITGKCADISKFKGPILRGVPARAPYFHNGSAAGLSDVIDFYNTRFAINFTDQEKADLIAFLSTL